MVGKIDDVDEMRYHLYCQSGGKMGCEYLSPCRDVLVLYTKRVNYQEKILEGVTNILVRLSKPNLERRT